jgi:hypothetical protein
MTPIHPRPTPALPTARAVPADRRGHAGAGPPAGRQRCRRRGLRRRGPVGVGALGELENVERNRDKSLGVSVYLGQRRGNASTSDFSPRRCAQTVQAAYDIARFTAEDPAAGLPDADDLATPAEAARDLDLFHPWAIDAAAAAELARAARPRRWPPTAASPIPKAPACRRSSRTSGPATRAVSRRLRQLAPLLSVAPIAGRARHAARRLVQLDARRQPNWPRPRPWAATPPSARWRG